MDKYLETILFKENERQEFRKFKWYSYILIKGFVQVYLYVHNEDIKEINILFILAVGANVVVEFFPICLQ